MSRPRLSRTALGLMAIALAVGGGLYVVLSDSGDTAPEFAEKPASTETHQVPSERAPSRPPQYFPGLPRPELVLFLSGQTFGYLQPCGCSRPQIGGLERRWELLSALRARGWVVSAADLGDAAPKQNDEQSRIKYETLLQVLQDMNYAGVGLGINEVSLPLDQALALAQNFRPVLAANLIDKENKYPGMFRPWLCHDPDLGVWECDWLARLTAQIALPGSSIMAAIPRPVSRPRAGYVGVIAESAQRQMKEKDASLTFEPVESSISRALKKMDALRPSVRVLLFQGTREEAWPMASAFPQFQVILTQELEEPSASAERIGETLLVGVGHKGRYIGLVGLFPQTTDPGMVALGRLMHSAVGGPLETTAAALASGLYPPATPWSEQTRYTARFQLVPLSEHYELPDDQTNLARERMRDYVARIYQEDESGRTFLTKYPRLAHHLQVDFPEAKFAGAAACQKCHPQAFAIWSKSRHSHAYESLAKYGRPVVANSKDPSHPIGRQHDPDCVLCHTTGFGYRTGYVNEKLTPHLFHNGCENCHGPASLHVAKPFDPKYSLPLRLSIATIESHCRRCHDGDNDPKFDLQKKWPLIQHGREAMPK